MCYIGWMGCGLLPSSAAWLATLNQEAAPSLLTYYLLPAAQDMGPSTTQTHPQPVHCNPAPGHVKEETHRRARRVAGRRQGGTGASSRLLQGGFHPKISKQQRSKASLPRPGSAQAVSKRPGTAASRLSKQTAHPVSQASTNTTMKRRQVRQHTFFRSVLGL